MPDTIPVLLDTDIGSDIDDALCLAYLLRQPRCEFVGITTVTGEPERRAMLADAICRAEGREGLPIHSGAAIPLLVDQRQLLAQQAEALARWPHRTEFPAATAVDFMRAAIRSRPGEVHLVAVGPMTNLGLLFALDPEIPSLLASLTLMGGVFTPETRAMRATEWNVSSDPHAAAIVYRAPVAAHQSLGLDVTLRCSLKADECRRRLRGGGLDLIADMAEVWFREAQRIVFHDPLAAAVVFEPDLVAEEHGRVSIALNGEANGLTKWSAEVDGPHRVAFDVEPDRFFAHYFGVLRV